MICNNNNMLSNVNGTTSPERPLFDHAESRTVKERSLIADKERSWFDLTIRNTGKFQRERSIFCEFGFIISP